VARARRRWIREQGFLGPSRLIDKTAVSTDMARLRRRAASGVRLIGIVPLGKWETITFVAALRHNKMIAPMVVDDAMTGEMFLAYVESCLFPVLQRKDIVVMDNCRIHLGAAIRKAIEKSGRHFVIFEVFTQPQPIELPYSKFDIFAQSSRTHYTGAHSSNSHLPPTGQPPRMCQLFHARRLCADSCDCGQSFQSIADSIPMIADSSPIDGI